MEKITAYRLSNGEIEIDENIAISKEKAILMENELYDFFSLQDIDGADEFVECILANKHVFLSILNK